MPYGSLCLLDSSTGVLGTLNSRVSKIWTLCVHPELVSPPLFSVSLDTTSHHPVAGAKIWAQAWIPLCPLTASSSSLPSLTGSVSLLSLSCVLFPRYPLPLSYLKPVTISRPHSCKSFSPGLCVSELVSTWPSSTYVPMSHRGPLIHDLTPFSSSIIFVPPHLSVWCPGLILPTSYFPLPQNPLSRSSLEASPLSLNTAGWLPLLYPQMAYVTRRHNW